MTWSLTEFASEAEWLAKRRKVVTSSDMPVILGTSPYSNAYDLWLAKVRGEDADSAKKMRRRFQAGHQIEPLIAQWFAEDTKRSPVRPADGYYLITNPALPWAAVTPDLLVIDGDGPDGVVESKSAGLMDLSAYETSPALSYAVAQLHLPLLVCEMAQGWVATTFGLGNAFRVYPVAKNWELAELIADRCSVFHKLIEYGEPPGEDFLRSGAEIGKALARIFEGETGELIEIEDRFAASAERIQELNGEIKEREAELDELKNALKLRMGLSTYARIPGYAKLAKWGTETKPAHTVKVSTTRVLRWVKDGKGKP